MLWAEGPPLADFPCVRQPMGDVASRRSRASFPVPGCLARRIHFLLHLGGWRTVAPSCLLSWFSRVGQSPGRLRVTAARGQQRGLASWCKGSALLVSDKPGGLLWGRHLRKPIPWELQGPPKASVLPSLQPILQTRAAGLAALHTLLHFSLTPFWAVIAGRRPGLLEG